MVRRIDAFGGVSRHVTMLHYDVATRRCYLEESVKERRVALPRSKCIVVATVGACATQQHMRDSKRGLDGRPFGLIHLDEITRTPQADWSLLLATFLLA